MTYQDQGSVIISVSCVYVDTGRDLFLAHLQVAPEPSLVCDETTKRCKKCLPSACFTEDTKGLASIKRIVLFQLAAMDLLLFGMQGDFELMLLDDHGDWSVFTRLGLDHRPWRLCLGIMCIFFCLMPSASVRYGWRCPTVRRGMTMSSDKTLTAPTWPRNARARKLGCLVDASVDFSKY